jgi:DNA-binding transcriptional LysR family regulator
VNDARVLREAALDGYGIILQADLILAEDLEAGRLVQILPDYKTPSRPLHILYSATRPPTQILRRFIDRVAAVFGQA